MYLPVSVPQGTKIDPSLPLIMINDLRRNDADNLWKYVDDTTPTTASEIVLKGIIFIRTTLQKSLEMPAYEYHTSGVPL
jgi:hypothetical protein